MKIGFVVMGHKDHNNCNWSPVKIVYTKQQILSDYDRYQLCAVSPEMYYTILGLKYNKTFLKNLALWRKELKIPEGGLNESRYFDMAQQAINYEPEAEGEVFTDPDYGEQLFYLSRKYGKTLKMHHYLNSSRGAGYSNWELLVLYGFVEPVLEEPITWEMRGWDTMFSSAQFNPFGTITINLHRRVTRNQIVKYINQHFKEIEKMMNLNLLPALPKTNIFISESDLKILDLKSKGFKDRKILDMFAEEYDEKLERGKISEQDVPDNLNEESFRMRYLRAKRRVNTLFREVKE